MAQAIGYVTKLEDGTYKGNLRMGVNTKIEIVENGSKDPKTAQPDYRVISSELGEVGGAWDKVGEVSGNPYISVTLAHPMIGRRKVYANLGQAHGGDAQDYALLWNPEG